MSVRILTGDCREVLAGLPAESVHCVVTSPPYWGLRDYGTAAWTGGDPDCAHRSPTMREGRNEDRAKLAGSAATNRDQLLLAHRTHCGKCGAVKTDQQLGLEPSLGEHIETMVAVFREVRRVLRKDGTVWLNYGDCYAASVNGRAAADIVNDDRTFRDKPFSTVGGTLKPKDLCMVPNRLAIALQDDGWWVRSEIIWAKSNPMPESVTDRPTSAHEKVFLLSKSARYFYDADAVRQPAKWPDGPNAPDKIKSPYGQGFTRKNDKQRGHGRRHAGFNDRWDAMSKEEQQTTGANLRNIWTIATAPFSEAHFATFPPELAERCIKAGTSEKGCCPECGAPWMRDVEVEGESAHSKFKRLGASEKRGRGGQKVTQSLDYKGGHGSNSRPVKTLGWSPSCDCDTLPTVPAVVLDPFAGTGTTGLVADRLGRDAILIELNPEYTELAYRRIARDGGMFADVVVSPPAKAVLEGIG